MTLMLQSWPGKNNPISHQTNQLGGVTVQLYSRSRYDVSTATAIAWPAQQV